MPLPVAHSSFAAGLTASRDRLVLFAACLVAIVPDLDFALVWGLGWPLDEFHRTFSHSLLFALILTGLWSLLRPRRLRALGPGLFFSILLSHLVLDSLCTANASRYGVMIFWPLSYARFGWPVLVPLYAPFGNSPFSVRSFLLFSLLEVFMALPLALCGALLRKVVSRLPARLAEPIPALGELESPAKE